MKNVSGRGRSTVKVTAAVVGAALLGAALTAGVLTMGPNADARAEVAPATKSESIPVANSKNYSITQTVTNNSSHSLKLVDTWIDNGGTVTQSVDTVAAQSSETYIATNHGNGVQLALTFTADNGDTVYVDTDVPKVWQNDAKATITGTGLSIADLDVRGGDNPKASIVLKDCTGSGCTTVAESP